MKQRNTIDLIARYLPIAGLVIVVILRFSFIEANDVAMDEPFTVFFAQSDLAALFRMLPQENNPPLFFLIMHFWVGWFGISPLSIRFLPAIFSILTAIMIFCLGRRFFTWPVGIFAAGLFAFSDYHQLFAHEARVYALFALLTTVSMYLFLLLSTCRHPWRYTFMLALVNALLIYAHFFGFFIFLIQGISILAIGEYRESILKHYFISLFISIIAYIPYFSVLFSRFFLSAGQGTWVEPPVLSDLYTMAWRYLNAPVITVIALAILVAALVKFFVGLKNGRKKGSKRNMVLVIWFVVPYLTMFLVSFKIPMFLDRYTVFISIGFYLLIAIALNSLVSGSKTVMIAMVVYIIMIAFTFHPRVDNKRRLKEAVAFISAHKTLNTRVVICPQWLEYGFAYRYDQPIFRNYKEFRPKLNQAGIFPANGLSTLDTIQLRDAVQVFVFEEWSTLTDPDQTIIKYLNRAFRYKQTIAFYENFKIHQYIK